MGRQSTPSVGDRVPPGPPWLGAHLSVAGGFDRAVEEAAQLGMNTLQIFTASPQTWPVRLPRADDRQAVAFLDGPSSVWRGRLLSAEEAERFRRQVAYRALHRPIAHSGYLINLAAPDVELWRRSMAALACELRRAGQLGLSHVVVHPGAYTQGDETAGIRRVAKALNEVLTSRHTTDARVMLENTAGQGTSLGWQFEQLAAILEQLQQPDLVDVCLDTCHAFAAGYELRTASGFRSTKRAIQRSFGWTKVQAIHVNDSKRDLGTRVDRHEHLGHGYIGETGFRRLLHDPDFRSVPMYLETPKGKKGNRSWDEINLQALRVWAE